MKFRVIVADPPWPFKDRLRMSKVRRGAAANYVLMTFEEINALGPLVQAVADDDAVLVMWVPTSLLRQGLDAFEAWGFRQTQVFKWVKTSKRRRARNGKFRFRAGEPLAFGMGRLFRAASEIALVGVRGSPYKYLKGKAERDVCLAPNEGHSVKPSCLQDSLDRMFPGPKVEIFGRRDRPGWLVLGNEVTGRDIRDDLVRLARPASQCGADHVCELPQ